MVRNVRHQPVIANLEKELVQLIWIVKAHSNGVPLRAKQKTREYLQQHKLNQEMVLHAQLQQTVNEETELVQQVLFYFRMSDQHFSRHSGISFLGGMYIPPGWSLEKLW